MAGSSATTVPARRGAGWSFVVGAAALLAGCQSTTDMFESVTSHGVPRLETGEAERRGPVINEAAFNDRAVSRTTAPYTGYVGSLRVDYAGDRAEIERDLRDLGEVAPPGFDPNGMVTINFTGASLGYILEQLLGGVLGVNYLAPDRLPGGIDFRTETPIPRSRIVQVVRDLLGRHGLVMRYLNGIYHIGTPEMIETVRASTALARAGDGASRIVRLERPNAASVAALAGQLLPPDVTVLTTSAANSLVVRADPNDIDSVERFLITLSRTANQSEKVAIIPLSRSAPEAVAEKLTEFYSRSLREENTLVTVVPLKAQQAILVSASDASLLRGVQSLAEQLDRSVTDVSDLRVIALTHLRAADIAPQLVQMFGATGAAAAAEPRPDPARPSTGVRARLRSPTPAAPADNEDGTGLAVPPPAAMVGGARDEPGRERPFPPSSAMAPQAGETRIVADEKSNSILVYSTYSDYKRMRDLVQTLDVPQAQVVIEATVLEVDLNTTLETGVQFFLQSNGIVLGSGIPAGNQSPSRGGVIGVGTTIGNVTVDAVLRTLREITNLRVISSPYLTVVDGQSARLVIGDQIPFASTTQTSNNAGNVTVTQQVEILDTGVVLEITPRIHANNSVNLSIVQSVSTPSTESEANRLTPVVATRDISSQILAQSGHTILLGGMIQDRAERFETGTPGAADLPVIGRLFKQEQVRVQRTELLVLITPRVVRSSSEIDSITRLLHGVYSAQGQYDLKR